MLNVKKIKKCLKKLGIDVVDIFIGKPMCLKAEERTVYKHNEELGISGYTKTEVFAHTLGSTNCYDHAGNMIGYGEHDAFGFVDFDKHELYITKKSFIKTIVMQYPEYFDVDADHPYLIIDIDKILEKKNG